MASYRRCRTRLTASQRAPAPSGPRSRRPTPGLDAPQDPAGPARSARSHDRGDLRGIVPGPEGCLESERRPRREWTARHHQSSMVRRRTLDWHFCPHCETQLDAETFICPACRWDPLAVPERPPRRRRTRSWTDIEGPNTTRATGHPPWTRPASPSPSASPPTASGRSSIVAFVAVMGLYGSMVVYTDYESHKDQPAAAFGVQR